ncbi:MAG: hybrid sensor histidine kinase/response regulator [Anaerolineae bacterium]
MTARLNRGTILIVDDVPTNLNVLMEFLESSGYRVLVAVDGESAIEQVHYARPDIILLDVMMPGIDGFETCRRLKADPATSDIPVIFMTALTDTVDKVHGFELGAADYVAKPLHQEEVVARVNAHLTLSHQRQEIEHLREQDRLQYETLSHMKDQVLSTASHDLKNPLATIMTATAVLRHYVPKDNDRATRKLDHIDEAAKHMRDLIVNLLDLARLETGVAAEKGDFSLNQILDSSFARAAAAAEEKQIKLTLRLLTHDVTMHCVGFQIGQALQNLISNALKYTPANGLVRVSAEVTEYTVCIHVADSGLGIPQESLNHLAQKFFRVNTVEHMAVAGTGLGLSIVREIARQHGGELLVISKLGVGSQFTISLPHQHEAGNN